MKYAFFTIPLRGHSVVAEELNRFLAGHRVAHVEKVFVTNGDDSVWSFCISYEPSTETGNAARRGKIDYREVLPEPEFQLYARLRSLRKTLAAEEGVPPYALFNNQQLAEMVTNRVDSIAGLREISGVGDARIEKYGEAFIQLLLEEIPKLLQPEAMGK